MRADIVPGAKFPDYELPDHTGTVRTLREFQGGDRGRFFPYGRER